MVLADKANLDLAKKSGATPGFMAAQQGHHETVGLLADKGANLDLANKRGSTPVSMAAQNGHHEVVCLLADKGANLGLARTNGTTPVFLAAQYGHHETVRVLADKGANLVLANKNGKTPIGNAKDLSTVATLLAASRGTANRPDPLGVLPVARCAALASVDADRRTAFEALLAAHLAAAAPSNGPPTAPALLAATASLLESETPSEALVAEVAGRFAPVHRLSAASQGAVLCVLCVDALAGGSKHERLLSVLEQGSGVLRLNAPNQLGRTALQSVDAAAAEGTEDEKRAARELAHLLTTRTFATPLRATPAAICRRPRPAPSPLPPLTSLPQTVPTTSSRARATATPR